MLDPKHPLRNASIVSVTKCSLAVLTRQDFNLIGTMYPAFKNKIFELARMRQMATIQKEKDAKRMQAQHMIGLCVVDEEADHPSELCVDSSITSENDVS